MKPHQDEFLSADEQGIALRLMLLQGGEIGAGGGLEKINVCLENGGEASEKEARRKAKAAEKQARVAMAAEKKEAASKAKQVAAPPKKLIGKGADASVEVEVGAAVDIASLVGSANFPPRAGEGEDPEGAARQRFYLTTAINYTNGIPHIGHAYEAISADVISRYYRLCGREVFFMTGTDEHGQKIANAAEKEGKQPIEICDLYAGKFQVLNKRLLISNDFYIRTTMPFHHKSSQELWKRCADVGDIYLGTYEGWYNEREETFVSEKDAKLTDFKDQFGAPLKKMSEASYFFKMSRHQEFLVQHLKDHPEFLKPDNLRADILKRLEEELNDLSISRTTFRWGIPMPDGFDESHVMYVWFDALSNYLSGVHALEPDHPLAKFWPADVHIIGKDITWFHCAIWPCMLKSAGLPLPAKVFAHGFISAEDGRKMSKSLGNVVDPEEMCKKYPVDTFRWYMMRETAFGSDLSFSKENLITAHNAELCDTLGNLVHRAVSLCGKYNDGKFPAPLEGAESGPVPFDVAAVLAEVAAAFDVCAVQQACILTMAALRDTNKFLTDAEPWKMGDERAAERLEVVRVTTEAVFVLAHLLAPVTPVAATAIFRKLGFGPVAIPTLRTDYQNIPPGTIIAVGNILFRKLELPTAEEGEAEKAAAAAAAAAAAGASGAATAAAPAAASAAAAPAAGGGVDAGGAPEPAGAAGADGKKKAKKEKAKAAAGGGGGGASSGDAAADTRDEADPSRLDIRVGVITKAWPHPESEKLFCEEIDIGEAKPRQIASGLRAFYKEEEMQGRRVLVLANLKARKMAGFESEGMVLCASNAEHTAVAFVEPPAAAPVGTRISFPGFDGPPATPAQVAKKKVVEKALPRLRTDGAGVPGCDGVAFVAGDAGACSSPLPDAAVS